MERIGRSHALRRAFNYSSSSNIQKGNLSLLQLARPFSSSGNPHQNEAESSNSNSNNNLIIRREVFGTAKGASPAPRSRPRVVDARSLGAARAGEGTVIRPSGLNRSLLRERIGGRIGGRATGVRAGVGPGRRGPGGAASMAKGRGGAGGAKRVKRRQSEEDEGDAAREAELEAVFAEIRNKERPKSTPHTPVQYDTAALKETWPSLPIGKTASTGTVLEQLSLTSRRYANGYVPPQELAKRLFEGERVLFSSEEEKAQAMEEVNKLAQERANKLTQRKGDLIEPEDTKFVAINDAERKALVGQLIRGNYENWQQGDERHPILDEVQRQLYNNETYRITGKQSEFVTKFQSLLASSQRAKRA